MDESEFQEGLLKRLDVLIQLQLERPQGDVAGISSRAQRLQGLGLSTGEIANILGKRSNYISALLKPSKKRKPSA